MVNLIRLLFLVAFVSGYSQSENSDIYRKFQKVNFTNDAVVLDNGILSNEYNIFYTKRDSSFISKYKFVVFGIKDSFSGYKSPLKAKFWVTPIRVFVDKNIEEKVRLEMINFINNFPKIRNLHIQLVTSRSEANYIITTSDSKLYVKIDSYNEHQNLEYFNGINFELIADKCDRVYSGGLYINTDQIINADIKIKKLKQFFMSSLGTFIISDFVGKESLLSEQYENNSIISDFDLKILQYHYDHKNDNEINNLIFEKIQAKLYGSEENKNYKLKI